MEINVSKLWGETLTKYQNGIATKVINKEHSYIQTSGGTLLYDGEDLYHISSSGIHPRVVKIVPDTIDTIVNDYLCPDREWIQALGAKSKHELFQKLGELVTNQSKIQKILSIIEE